VIVFDAQGKYLKTWGEGSFPYAHGMRALGDGYIWTTDRQAQLVLKFDGDGKQLFSLGQKGVAGNMESTGAFNGASDVAMAANGDIFVSDGEGQNTRVVKFSKDGTFIGTTDGKVLEVIEGLDAPHGIAVDASGAIYVAQSGGKSIVKFVKK
jgi:sugar lactone lactonase YvrE